MTDIKNTVPVMQICNIVLYCIVLYVLYCIVLYCTSRHNKINSCQIVDVI